jgi:hypothetical protein
VPQFAQRGRGPGIDIGRLGQGSIGQPPQLPPVRMRWSGTWHMDLRIGTGPSRGEGARPQAAGGAAITTLLVLATFPPASQGWRN